MSRLYVSKFHRLYEESDSRIIKRMSIEETSIANLAGKIAESCDIQLSGMFPLQLEISYPGICGRVAKFMEKHNTVFIPSPYFDKDYCTDYKFGKEVTYSCLINCTTARWFDFLGFNADEREFTSRRNNFLLKYSVGSLNNLIDELTFPSREIARESIKNLVSEELHLYISGEQQNITQHVPSYWRRKGLAWRFGIKGIGDNINRGMPEKYEEAVADSHFVFFSHDLDRWKNREFDNAIKPLIYAYDKTILRIEKDFFVAIPGKLVDISQFPYVKMRFPIHKFEDERDTQVYQSSLSLPSFKGTMERNQGLYMEYY